MWDIPGRVVSFKGSGKFEAFWPSILQDKGGGLSSLENSHYCTNLSNYSSTMAFLKAQHTHKCLLALRQWAAHRALIHQLNLVSG